MLFFGVCLFLSACCCPFTCCCQFTFGHDEKFEYECDILQRLERAGAKLQETEQQIQQLQDQATGGSTYTRWGRTVCPGNGSELVYKGVAAGSLYNQSGAAAEYICLPLDPEFGEYYEDTPQTGGYVYGAEYQLNGLQRTDYMDFFPDIPASPNLLDQNSPCAVCRVSRGATIMIPAKKSCVDGWTLEYKGMLMSGSRHHAAATRYICLDGEPEFMQGGGFDESGKLLYFVEGRCGSLPCPPYVDGREMTCAVCTK